MVGAFFGKTDKKEKIFQHLDITKEKAFESHLTKHDVIYRFQQSTKRMQNLLPIYKPY